VHSDWSKTYVLSEYKTWKKRVLLFYARKVYIKNQMKKPRPCIKYHLLTESEVITGKFQTEALMY